jgi:putative ABC transport system substrate-binding protein
MRLVAVEMALAKGDEDGQHLAAAFEQSLRQLGWTPGQNLRVEYRWDATNAERASAQAAEILTLNPDVIVAHATIVTRAFFQKSTNIPIVFLNVSDPLGEHFVESFARPGRSLTGFTNIEPSIGGKYLELLKKIAPTVTRAAMIFNPASTPGGGSYFSGSFDAAAAAFAIQPIKAAVHNTTDIEHALAALAGNGGLVVIGEPFINLHREEILRLSAQYRLPTICPYRLYAREGCLISYGVDFADQFARAATYVDRILKGETAANLPVQSPVKFEFVINLKTAKALGVEVPPMLLATADEVIE